VREVAGVMSSQSPNPGKNCPFQPQIGLFLRIQPIRQWNPAGDIPYDLPVSGSHLFISVSPSALAGSFWS
jgi:hypothetical protein